MEGTKITVEEIKDSLKYTWYVVDSKTIGTNYSDSDYKRYFSVDMETLSKMYGETHVYNEVTITKVDDENYKLCYCTMINDSPYESLCGSFDFNSELADVYMQIRNKIEGNKEEDKEVLNLTKEDIGKWLNSNTDNIDTILNVLKEDFDVNLKDYVEITEDDIDDSLKEDIAYSYIENYPNESMDKAVEIMGTYDLKEHLKDIIDNL